MSNAFPTSYHHSRMGPRVRPLAIHQARTRRNQVVVLAVLAVLTGAGAFLEQSGAGAAAHDAVSQQPQPFSYFPN